MSKKLLLSCLAAVLVFTAACSKDNKNNGSEASSSAVSSSPTASESAPASEPASEAPKDKVTFSYFLGVANAPDVNTNETTIGKVLEDQTGVNFKIEHLVGDLKAKIGTMIASNDYPDVINPDAGIDQLLDAGAFIDLTDMIEKYPNIKRVYGPYLSQMKAADGKIYFIPFSNVVGGYTADPNINQGAFWIQRRVLKEAGYPKIKTLEEYMNLIEEFVAKHKDENLTGLVTLTHDWRFFATSNVPMHLDGYPNDGNVEVDMSTFEAKTYYTTDSTKNWLQKLNDFNAKGLFDKASFVDNYDQYLAKLSSKKVVGFFDYGWQTGNARNLLTDAARQDPTQDDFVYQPMPLTWDGSKDQLQDPPGFVKNRGIGISVSAKDPERIMEYWDNLLKEENQVLRSWGIKGETYEVDDKGRFLRTAEQIAKIDEPFNLKFGFRYYAWDWPQYGTNSTLADGNALAPGYQPEVFQMSLTDADKMILEKYGVKTYAELFADPDERVWFPAWGIPKAQGSPEQIWETTKDEITKKFYPKLVLAKPADFDKVWDEYLTAFGKIDTAGYEKWYTEQIKAAIEAAK
ncbi:ABC transporter substrate-binding protein [Cohnella lupini]|uniref:Aldotetraouronic acid ABC transporter substrate-binding protein n=1 Tax=Cohnella lupini TaxID=1294267 RepID=A0A3D9HQT9_9BACL|nr:ABC transporter substrate-binding protein [Cohnella lupini]RED51838.1 aldotetraouronic acid ABC transporter substrate-binding protein [Cohnella lupini]